MHTLTRTTAALAALAIAGVTAGCGSSTAKSSSQPSTSPSASASPSLSGSATVLAASSLTGAFTTLAKQFEAANAGTTVKLSFGASSALALQITNGAKVDVFASASPKNMKQIVTGGEATTSTDFVQNVMEIAVPPSNPAGITAVADLAKSGVKVALCEAQVPCGSTAEEVFTNAKIKVTPVTEEADVKSTLAKVESNEVDAGVVYVTDVLAAKSKVKGIEIPAAINASTEYPIATLTKAPNAAVAKAFMAYVLSSAGQSVLTAAGFEKP
jgi:molybdate transport system substrate-binding protein